MVWRTCKTTLKYVHTLMLYAYLNYYVLSRLFCLSEWTKTMQTQCYLQRPTAIPGLECRPFASCCRRIRSYWGSTMADIGDQLRRRTYHQDTWVKVFQMPCCYIPHILHWALWYSLLYFLILPPLSPIQVCQMQFENGWYYWM